MSTLLPNEDKNKENINKWLEKYVLFLLLGVSLHPPRQLNPHLNGNNGDINTTDYIGIKCVMQNTNAFIIQYLITCK